MPEVGDCESEVGVGDYLLLWWCDFSSLIERGSVGVRLLSDSIPTHV